MICEFSDALYKKEKGKFDKQSRQAHDLIEHSEPEQRARFVKKSKEKDKPFIIDKAHQAKSAKLPDYGAIVRADPENTPARE
jgi:hypothetical protein